MNEPTQTADGQVLNAARVADYLAIQDLALCYAHAVDHRDWQRWEALSKHRSVPGRP